MFIHSENQGAYTTMNDNIANASGDYIAILNSDDAWVPQKLEKQVKFLDENPDIAAVFSYMMLINEKSVHFEDNSFDSCFNQPNRTRYEWLNRFFF